MNCVLDGEAYDGRAKAGASISSIICLHAVCPAQQLFSIPTNICQCIIWLYYRGDWLYSVSHTVYTGCHSGHVPIVDLGFITEGGYALDGALSDMLPVLPENPVSVGSNWDTQRDVRTLVGWAWTQGQLDCHHEVTAVEQQGNHTIVSVTSSSSTVLSAVEGTGQYSGNGQLSRNYQWRFDDVKTRNREIYALRLTGPVAGHGVLSFGAVAGS